MINRNPKVSIIVVSLNTKLFFLETVKSIINQCYKNKEIIIVDGNSVDGTVQEIKKLKNKFSKIIIKKDKGIYDAMNRGIRISSGKWILFLNSGDIFNNRKVLSNIFRNQLFNKDIIFGNTLVKNNNIRRFVEGKNFTKNTIVMPFCHQSTMVKTDILKKNQFSLKYKYSSDFNFFFKCFEKKIKFYKLNQIIAHVRANGVSDKNRQKVYNENIQILKKNNFSFRLIINLWFIKLATYFKDFTKYILPSSFVVVLLKLKYLKRV